MEGRVEVNGLLRQPRALMGIGESDRCEYQPFGVVAHFRAFRERLELGLVIPRAHLK